MTRLIAVLIMLVASMGVGADTVSTTVQEQPVAKTREQIAAATSARWGLTPQEWVTYERIMENKRGVWSPGLDPITALGVSADTVSERKRYADLYVRTEFERTRKELAFQLAVDSAWARLYPHTPRIGQRTSASDAGQAKHRYALIVTPDCLDCEAVMAQRLPEMISEAREGVDVHVVGTGGDNDVLRRWIASQPGLLAALESGRATVNHGSQFQDLERFPVIYSKTGSGQWAREL